MRLWTFVPDMNFNGTITVSDCWLWFEWLFFYPGDFLIHLAFDRSSTLARFLELESPGYGGSLSGVPSLLFWIVLIKLLVAAARAFREPHDYAFEDRDPPPDHAIARGRISWWTLALIGLVLSVYIGH